MIRRRPSRRAVEAAMTLQAPPEPDSPWGTEPITVTVPTKTVSEINCHDGWATRFRRGRAQREEAAERVRGAIRRVRKCVRPTLPLTITATRITPRGPLGNASLVESLRAVCDGVCEGLGIDSGAEGLTIEHLQERGPPRAWSVRVEISR